jgi:hypothetical protein
MKLPSDVISRINLKVSRHKQPEKLDWIKINGKWQAVEDGRTFVLIHDSDFGNVVAETKKVTMDVGPVV